jgi:hypothetical protein
MERDSLVGYESTLANALEDMLYTPDVSGRQPLKRVTLTFPRLSASRLKVSLLHSKPGEVWAIHEMRVSNAGIEVPRSPAWRIDADPDPWEAPFAFDNNPATRWSSEKAVSDGAFLEIAFGRSTEFDSVSLDCATGESEQLVVAAEIEPGKMVPLNATVGAATLPLPPGLRRGATRMLKSYGFDYLMMNDADYYADDFTIYTPYWGIRQVARTPGHTLFRIE